MAQSDPKNWFSGSNNSLAFMLIMAALTVIIIPIILFVLVKYCGFQLQLRKVNTVMANILKLKILKDHVGPKPVNAETTLDTNESFNYCVGTTLHTIWILCATLLTIYVAYKVIRFLFAVWNPNSVQPIHYTPGWQKVLAMDKTDLYFQLMTFGYQKTSYTLNLYIGSYFGSPENLEIIGGLHTGQLQLDKRGFFSDYIDIDWHHCHFELDSLEIPLPSSIAVPFWLILPTRRSFAKHSTYFRIIAHNPTSRKIALHGKSTKLLRTIISNKSTIEDTSLEHGQPTEVPSGLVRDRVERFLQRQSVSCVTDNPVYQSENHIYEDIETLK